jgi:hypothetical protein
MNKTRLAPCLMSLALIAFIVPAACSQTASATPDPHAVAAVDGGLGPCSADFIVTGEDGKPVYAAKISVHIAYGLWSLHKLDLEVSTNIDGKARFTGLPASVKRGLYFQASESDRTAVAFEDPSATCKAQLPVTLRKSSK